MNTAAQLESLIHENLPYDPLESQGRLIHALSGYATDRTPQKVFILNGYAGTGKTSIIGALVKGMQRLKLKTVVLAPTGRAAKVAANLGAGKASTIHKRIFRPDSPEPGAGYFLASNRDAETLFIIDEASLISGSAASANMLLPQLLRHIYSAPGCAALFVGDTAQLPPVGQSDSPAMNPEQFRRMGFEVEEFTLTEPARQARESGILALATAVREIITSGDIAPGRESPTAIFSATQYPDVTMVDNRDLADSISGSWQRVGIEETVVITRSNRRANLCNQAIRNLVMCADEPLQRGERLVVSKNDYYWPRINKCGDLIANGDTAVVEWSGRPEKHYGRYFVDTELWFPADESRISAKLMLRSLMAEGASLPQSEMERFYRVILASMPEDSLTNRMAISVKDPYFNALQAKYAYCLTCHKAQGGQWREVYVDLCGIDPALMGADYYRWLYTALTRASERLFIIS